MSNQSSNRQSIFIAAVVSLGGFLFGFDASVISGVIGFVTPQMDLNDIEVGWLVSSPSVAAMFAMLIAGTVSDYIGRKKVLIIAALLYSISALFSAIAPTYEILIGARMIGGIGFGAALVLAPMYIAEIAPPERRGVLVSIQQFNIVIGFSVSYFSNYAMLNAVGDVFTEFNVWRWMLGIEFLPAIFYFIAMFFVPRSPRWLLSKGKEVEAEQVLERVFGKEKSLQEKDHILQNLQEAEASRPQGLSNLGILGKRLQELFSPKLRIVLTVALVIGIIQQVTGVNAIYFYAPSIFEQSGVGTNAAFAQAVLLGVINVIFTVVAMGTIDRFGRKPLLLAGLAGVILSMGITAYGFGKATYTLSEASGQSMNITAPQITAIYGQTFDNDVEFKRVLKEGLGNVRYAELEAQLIQQSISVNSKLVLFGILLFVASFATSLGPVMWVLLSEIFPNSIRGVAIAVIGFVNSLSSTLVQFFFKWELANLGNALTFLIFGVFGLIGFLIMWKMLPETKGKTLEELEKELSA
jgi:SP family arabinose:H+ symporter-like MFS transporter